MNKFNKLYEDIFKPASFEEVKERKKLYKLEELKDWMNRYNIEYTTDDKDNIKDIIDYNKVDEFGNTPLMIAASLDIESIVNYLLEKPNIITNNLDNTGSSIFYDASENMVNLLVSSPKININMDADYHYKIPVLSYIITFFYSNELFDMILERSDLDINKQDSLGRTPLMVAIENNKETSYKINKLLQSGADTTIKDKDGKDWLFYINKYVPSTIKPEIMQLYRKYNKNKE